MQTIFNQQPHFKGFTNLIFVFDFLARQFLRNKALVASHSCTLVNNAAMCEV